MQHKITLYLSKAYYRIYRAYITLEKITLVCSEDESLPRGSRVHKEFNHKPLFDPTETLRKGKNQRRVLTHSSSTRNGTRQHLDLSQVHFH